MTPRIALHPESDELYSNDQPLRDPPPEFTSQGRADSSLIPVEISAGSQYPLGDNDVLSVNGPVQSIMAIVLRNSAKLNDILDSMGNSSRTSSSSVEYFEEPITIDMLGELASAFRCRFGHTDNILDLNHEIKCLEKLVFLTHDTHVYKPGVLNDLGNAYQCRFNRMGTLSDIEASIGCQVNALSLTPDDHAERPGRLSDLGSAYQGRFEYRGDLLDINESIECQVKALSLIPEGHADVSLMLNNLGNAYQCRFEHQSNLSDIQKAIECQVKAVSLADSGSANRPIRLNNLGISYRYRFKLTSDLADINRAIECQEEAVLLTPDVSSYLSNLGHTYQYRFQELDNLEDLNRAIECHTKAVSLTLDNYPSKPAMLNNLGNAYQLQFKRLGELVYLHKAIESHMKAVSLTPESHADMALWLNGLGYAYQLRFERLSDFSDLEEAIKYQVKALLLTPPGHADQPGRLSNLGATYRCRFEHKGNTSDLDSAIKCQVEAVSLTPNGHACMPLLLNNLGNQYQNRFQHLGELSDINKAIECMIKALSLTPKGHADQPARLTNIGNAYQRRFQKLGDLSDINRAIEYQVNALSLGRAGHADMGSWLCNVGVAYRSRFERLGDLSDINRAIDCQFKAVSLTLDGDINRPKRLNALGAAYLHRFNYQGHLSDVNKAIECQTEALSLTPDDHAAKAGRLNDLGGAYRGRFKLQTKVSDIDKAIELQTIALSGTPDGHASKPAILVELGISYRYRFEELNNTSDISKAVECQVMAVSLAPHDDAGASGRLYDLGVTYANRFKHLYVHQDLDAAIQCFREASQSILGPPRHRFRAARQLARLTKDSDPPSSQLAYQQTMALIPQLVWHGTTTQRRYERIVEIGDIAAEAANYAITRMSYDSAIERLEEGRSIVWNQILQLRSPLEIISKAHPTLAEELQEVGQALEQAGSRLPTTTSLGKDYLDIEKEAQQHYSLATKWDKLLNQARGLVGFNDFMQSRNASELKQSAKGGAIVVISLYESFCHALILPPNTSEVVHVPLQNFSTDKAFDIQKRLTPLTGRQGHPSRAERRPCRLPQAAEWKQPLRTLWLDMVQPVLVTLGYTRQLPVDRLPRITWCTTGPLSFLPLHAAGPYDGMQPNTFDLVVSSYTPTLSALLAPPSCGSCPGILIVGQEETPGQAPLPHTRTELVAIEGRAMAVRHMQLSGEHATASAVLKAMEEYSWVHLACHAVQDVLDPSQSAFQLYDGTLTLSDITKKSFKNKGLAFLSACQTATGDSVMPDEAIHLAAGMLMAGYPSVIATMWSIQDQDGPGVSDKVYGELLKDGKADCTGVARALHEAITCLRNKVGIDAVDRWAPFIHVGS